MLSATYLAALVVLVVRYRRGTEQVRRQLLWLLLATAVAVALVAVTRLGGSVEDNGIAFQADAVVNLADTDPAEVRALGGEIRGAVGDALADVRRLIYQLRPAALDEWGLVEAVRRHAQRLAPLDTRITAGEVPALSAAVEVAAYRIVTEALTNVARHSRAGCAEVVIAPSRGALCLTVRDDGAGSLAPWEAGVGLRSLRERAAELGGGLEAAPTPSGGEVRAWLPVFA